ncbi:MAG: uncharacterized protein KVP18_004981 [Porospora cf. gigantea A]|uniref:uncharacterized protein n=1 Tax=Porospora cf. gigantea A TaxID=2853593 RepID=UPI0035596B56|nr:MAG: hypothetical protein KVP18_004981 [Porospora cf. gigantea A]
MDCCLIVEAGQVSQDSYVKERRDFQAKEWLAAQSKLKEENEKPYFHGAMWLVDPSECVGVNIGRDPNCYILLNHQEISSHHLHITWDQEEIAELGRHLQQSDLPFFTTKSLQHHNAAENLVADAACCLNVIDASFNGSFIKGKRLPKNDVHKCGLGEEISFGRGMYDQGMLIPLVSFSFKLVRSSNPLVSIIKATPSPPVATILERARLDPSPFARADRSPFRSPHRRRTDVCVNQEYHSTLETERLTEELKSVGEERNRLLDDVCTLRMEVAEMRVGEERLQSQARESNRLRAELAECRAETEAKQRQVEQLFLENSGLNERLRKLEFEKDDVVFKADKLQEVMKSRSMEVDSLVEKVSSLNAVINRQTAKTESVRLTPPENAVGSSVGQRPT